jgi:hypothetical protein
MKKSILGIVLFLLMGSANATDYKTLLNGKTLYIKGGNCAGLSLAKNSGLMGNQSPCKVDLPTKLRWLNNDLFMMVEKNQISESSPPRVFIYKIKSLKGNQIVLSEIWTGWNNFPDEDITYTIK